MNLTEKAAYLKGLMEGLGIGNASKEDKIFMAMADLLADLALSVEDVEDRVDCIDEDLAGVEEFVFGDEHKCGCGCEDEEDVYEVECPKCGDSVYLDEDLFSEGSIECPACGELIEFGAAEADDEDK